MRWAGVVDPNMRPLQITTVSWLCAMRKGKPATHGGVRASMPALDGEITLWELLKVPPFVSHEHRLVVGFGGDGGCGGEEGLGWGSDGYGDGNTEDAPCHLGLWDILNDVGSTCHP